MMSSDTDPSSGPSTPPPVVFSVVMAAFNPGGLIRQAIDSALGQTFSEVEVIVVDDASTDASSGIMRGYGEDIHLIRMEENVGPAAARNAALHVARGRYVAVLDADDYWMPERLEKVMDHFEQHPDVALATTDSVLVFGTEESSRTWFSTEGTRFHRADQGLHIFDGNFLSSQIVYKRELFEDFGYYDERLRIGEDWDRAIAFLQAGARAGRVDEVLAAYRVHPGGASRDQDTLIRAKKQVLEKWLAADLGPRAHQRARRAWARVEWQTIKSDAQRGSTSGIRRRLRRLILSGPPDVRAKAAAWWVFPRWTSAVAAARLNFIVDRGSSWALHEAVEALEQQDERAGRRGLQAVAVFGFPLRTRLLAITWLLIPPMRPFAYRKLRADPLLTSRGERS